LHPVGGSRGLDGPHAFKRVGAQGMEGLSAVFCRRFVTSLVRGMEGWSAVFCRSLKKYLLFATITLKHV